MILDEQRSPAAALAFAGVSWQSTISVGGRSTCSVMPERVWARAEHRARRRPRLDLMARARCCHELTTPGRLRLSYPPRPRAERSAAQSAEEAEFLAIGEGATQWLTRAAALALRGCGARAEAVALGKLHGRDVDAWWPRPPSWRRRPRLDPLASALGGGDRAAQAESDLMGRSPRGGGSGDDRADDEMRGPARRRRGR